jgi:Uma2 family endonuclease
MATDTASNEPSMVLPAVLQPAVEQLVTEDETPVDGVFSEKQMRLLTEPLHTSWAGPGRQRSFEAMANVALFFTDHRPPMVPDVLLSLDVELPPDVYPKKYRSYFLWEYGKPPDIVIEVVSNREGGEDTSKVAAYARGRVPYYVIYDPEMLLSADVLRSYRLDVSEYRKMAGPIDFPTIGLGLRIWHGRYEDLDAGWVRWVDESDAPIPTGFEQRQRAERLAAQLRQLGVKPEV